MLHSSLRYAAFLGLFALTACSGKGDDDTGGTGAAGGMGGSGGTGGGSGSAGMPTSGSAGMPAGMCATSLTTSPDNNYQFESTLTINPVEVKPGTELTLDWSGVTQDFLKRPVDLNKIDMVEVGLWARTIDQFEVELNDDTLMNPLVLAYIVPNNHATSGSILNAQVPIGSVPGNTILDYLKVENYAPDTHLYAVMVANGNDYGRGTYMLGAFKLNASSTNTTVKVSSTPNPADPQNTSTKVDFKATIASRPPTYIPAGTGDITLDWTKMKLTAAGHDFLPANITRMRIGHYTQTPAELEGDNFLQLDEIAQEMFEYKVDIGTKATFSSATSKTTGMPFAGIDDTGTWIVALNCGMCQNPAPWYLAVLKPCAATQ